MADIILHHYPISPFSEKIRLVLGYKKLAWKSVIIPSIMPKPDVLALTGGYRKTPFLQIGSDVYCDSTLFWAAMAYNLQPRGAAAMFEGVPPEVAKAFGADRAAMAASMTRLRPADATAAYKSYLRRLANMLEGQDFLLGCAPCVADFAAYHPLWFTRRCVPVMAGILDATPAVLAWMDRMAALGHGRMEKFSATEAIAACAASTGATALNDTTFQDEHGIALGSRVTVSAETFGQELTEGELLAATRTHYTVRRTDDRAGTVQVHFPRIGYVLKKADA